MKQFIGAHAPIMIGVGIVAVAGVSAYCGIQLGLRIAYVYMTVAGCKKQF